MDKPLAEKLVAWGDALLARTSPARLFARKPQPVSAHGSTYASFNRRMLANVLDASVLMLLLSPFNAWMMHWAYGDVLLLNSHFEPVQQAVAENRPFAAIGALMSAFWQSGLITGVLRLLTLQYVVFAAYSVVFWRWWAATPGKWLLRMRVVDEATGAPLSARQGVVRALGYLLASIPFLLGMFAISWHPKRRGWHDVLAGTSVVVIAKPVVARPSNSPAPTAGE